jgi:hypothetical protein
VTGGPGGDWDAIEEALEGLPVARPQVDARDAEIERLRVDLRDYRLAAEAEAAFADEFKAERDSARAELSDLYPAIESLRDELRRARAAVANEIADKIAGLARYNCELGYDGTEDRTTAAWVEGIHNAADIARSFADPEGEK